MSGSMPYFLKYPAATAIGQIIWFAVIATHAPFTAIGFGVAVGVAALPDGAADGVADGPAHAEMTARPPSAAVERRNVRREMRSMAIPPGVAMLARSPSQYAADRVGDLSPADEVRVLEDGARRDRREGRAHAGGRRREPVDRFLGDHRRHLRAEPADRRRLVRDHEPGRAADRTQDGLAVEGVDRAKVHHLDRHALGGELVRRGERLTDEPRGG